MKERTLKILDHVVEYGVYGFIFMLPFSTAGVSIFSGLAVAAFLARQVITPDFSVMRTNKVFFLILAGFFFFMALSLLNSGPLLGKSLHALFIKWGRFVLILWIIFDVFRTPERVIRVMWVFVASVVLLAITTLSQKFFGVEFLCRRPLSGRGIITGPFKNQNSLAGYLTCVIPAIFMFALSPGKRIFLKLLIGALGIVLLFLSLWAGSRGGWIALAAGLYFCFSYLYLNFFCRKRFLNLILVFFVVFLPVVVWMAFFFQNRSVEERILIYSAGWRMITEEPLWGKGLGTFMHYAALYTNNLSISYAHNCYLQIWAESGIFSLIFFLFLLGFVFFKSIRVLLQAPASLPAFILAGLTSGFLAISIHLFSDTHLYSLQISFLFWTILGLTYALTRIMEQERAQPQ